MSVDQIYSQALSMAANSRGMSLLELLVAMALIGVLIALLLPAVQAAREAVRRASCQNNLKQIGVAVLSFENAHGKLPVGAQSVGKTNVTYGVSWWVDVLPYLESSAIADRIDTTGSNCGSVLFHTDNAMLVNEVAIAPMACPSSPLPRLKQVGGVQVMMPSYVGIAGASSHGGFPETRVATCCQGWKDGEISAGGVLVPNRAIRFSEVIDGASNTLIVGEASDFAIDAKGNQRRIDGGFNHGWLIGTNATGTPPEYSTSRPPRCWNITTIRYPVNTRDYMLDGIRDNHGANNPLMSVHPNGTNGLYLDGSVQFFDASLDLTILKSQATRDDSRLGGT